MRPDAGNERSGRRGSDVRIPRRTDKRDTDAERSAERLPRPDHATPTGPRRGFDQPPPRVARSSERGTQDWDQHRSSIDWEHQPAIEPPRGYERISYNHHERSHEAPKSFEHARHLDHSRQVDHTRFRERYDHGPEREQARSVERGLDAYERLRSLRYEKYRSANVRESATPLRYPKQTQRPPIIPKGSPSYMAPRQGSRDLVMGYPAPRPSPVAEDQRVLQMGVRSSSLPRISQRNSIKLAVSKRDSAAALLPGAESSTSSSNDRFKAESLHYDHLLNPAEEPASPAEEPPAPVNPQPAIPDKKLSYSAPLQNLEEMPSVPTPPVKDTTWLPSDNQEVPPLQDMPKRSLSERRVCSPCKDSINTPSGPPSSPTRPRRASERLRHTVTDTDSESESSPISNIPLSTESNRSPLNDAAQKSEEQSIPPTRKRTSSSPLVIPAEVLGERDRLMQPFKTMLNRCNAWIPLLVKPPTEATLREICAMLELSDSVSGRLFEDDTPLDENRLAEDVKQLIRALEERVRTHAETANAYEVGAAKLCRGLLEGAEDAGEFYRSKDMVGDPIMVRFPSILTQIPSTFLAEWPKSNTYKEPAEEELERRMQPVFESLREMGELVSDFPWEVTIDDDLVNTVGTFPVFDARPDDVIFNLIKDSISKKLIGLDLGALGQLRAQCRKAQRKWLRFCNNREESDVVRFGVLPMRASVSPDALSIAPSGGWPWLMPGGQYVTKRNTIDKLLLESQWFSLGAKTYMRPLSKQSATQRPILSFYNDIQIDKTKPICPALYATGHHAEDRPMVRTDILKLKPAEDMSTSAQKIYPRGSRRASKRLLPSGMYNYTGPPPNWSNSALLDPPYVNDQLCPLDIQGSLRAQYDPFIDEAFESCSVWTVDTLLTFARLTFENGYNTKVTSNICQQPVKACTILYGLLKFWMRSEQVDEFTAIEMSSADVKVEDNLSDTASPRKRAKSRDDSGPASGRIKKLGSRSKNPHTEAMVQKFTAEFVAPLFEWVANCYQSMKFVGVGMTDDCVTLLQIRQFKIQRVQTAQWPRPWMSTDTLIPDDQELQYYPQGTSLILPQDVEAVIVQDKAELHIAGRRADELPTAAIQVAERVTTGRDIDPSRPPEETIEENYRGLLGAVALKNEAVQRELSKIIASGLTTKGLSDAVMSIFVRHNSHAVEAYTPMAGPAVPQSPKLSPQFQATRSSPVEPPPRQESATLRDGGNASRESQTLHTEDDAENDILQDLLYGPIH